MNQIKINYNNTTKRSALPKSFTELIEVIKNSFGIVNQEETYFDIKYVDDEGDNILISNQFDYEQALEFSKKQQNTLKVFIALKSFEDGFKEEGSLKKDASFEVVKQETEPLETEVSEKKSFE